MGPDLEKQTQIFGATVQRERDLERQRETEPLTGHNASRSVEIQVPPRIEENPFRDYSASVEKTDSRYPPLIRSGSSKSAAPDANEGSMWPSMEQLKKRARYDKRLRSRNPMTRLGKKGKIIASILIAMTIMGLAVGIGVGVSRATHGEVWAGNGKSNPIPG